MYWAAGALALWFVVGAPLVLFLGFVYDFTLKKAREAEVWVPWFMVAIGYVLLPVGVVADASFNLFWGRVIFRELNQRGSMFTHRVQWHLDHGAPPAAVRWARLGNFVYPGHFKRVPAEVE